MQWHRDEKVGQGSSPVGNFIGQQIGQQGSDGQFTGKLQTLDQIVGWRAVMQQRRRRVKGGRSTQAGAAQERIDPGWQGAGAVTATALQPRQIIEAGLAQGGAGNGYRVTEPAAGREQQGIEEPPWL